MNIHFQKYIGDLWKIDHILACKGKLNKPHKSRLILTTISHCIARKLDFNNKVKKSERLFYSEINIFWDQSGNTYWNLKNNNNNNINEYILEFIR